MSEINNTLTCTFHPNVETQLRCNRCNKPICIKCAKHTPTGYRCPECGDVIMMVTMDDGRSFYICQDCQKIYTEDELKKNKKQ